MHDLPVCAWKTFNSLRSRLGNRRISIDENTSRCRKNQSQKQQMNAFDELDNKPSYETMIFEQ